MNNRKNAILMAILAAVLYGISSPISKLLLVKIHPTLMAALLYLGAGLGMLFVNVIRSLRHKARIQAKLTRKELPYVVGMIILDIAAPILLMIALTLTSAANTSLINNFEIVATALIALFLFKETIGRYMWIAITLITLGCIFLSINDAGSFDFSAGSLFAVLACVCWGFENNCTRKLSVNDPLMIVVIKGFGSGIGSLIIAIAIGQCNAEVYYWVMALFLGAQHFFLCFCAANFGCGKNECILRDCPVHRSIDVVHYFRAKDNRVVCHCLCFHDRRS
jgi:drug/metabolite transporter (DMT)-like permease